VTTSPGAIDRRLQLPETRGKALAIGDAEQLNVDPTPAYLGWSSHIEMESMVKPV
jgi:hypothetical protein